MKTVKLLLIISVLMTSIVNAQVKWTPRYANGEYNVNGLKITIEHKGTVIYYGDASYADSPEYISFRTTYNSEEFKTLNKSYKLKNIQDYDNFINNLFEKRGIITEEFIRKYRCYTNLTIYFNPEMEIKYIYFSYNNYIDKLSLEDIADLFKFIINSCKIESTKKIEGKYIFNIILNCGYSSYSKRMLSFISLKREVSESKDNGWVREFRETAVKK